MVAAAVIGSAVVGGVMQGNAAKDAANTQAGATDRAAAATERQYQQNRADMTPWREAGVTALNQQTAGMVPGGDFNRDFTLSDFTADPGYQYRLDQGREALEGSAAARGQLLSGGTLKALTRYGQDQGSGEYQSAYQRFNADRDRRFNRLSAVAGTGQTATNNIATMGAAATESSNTSRVSSADTQAAGTIGAANGLVNGMNSAVNGYMSLNTMNRMMPTSATPSMYSGGGSSMAIA